MISLINHDSSEVVIIYPDIMSVSGFVLWRFDQKSQGKMVDGTGTGTYISSRTVPVRVYHHDLLP